MLVLFFFGVRGFSFFLGYTDSETFLYLNRYSGTFSGKKETNSLTL
jgi:hypothetical protein